MHVNDLPDRAQDYLKAIYDVQEWSGGGAALTKLAAHIGQRPSTASEAVKRLAAQGLVDHAPYGDITLTDAGRRLALAMVRRHRLIETYLCQELGYTMDEVHAEAEVLEHAVSDTFIERISQAMGHPRRDPHGDPIPDGGGRMRVPTVFSLGDVAAGDTVYVDRVSDRDADLLRHLQRCGVLPGAEVRVLPRPYPEMAEFELSRTADGRAVGEAARFQLSVSSLGAVLCRVGERDEE